MSRKVFDLSIICDSSLRSSKVHTHNILVDLFDWCLLPSGFLLYEWCCVLHTVSSRHCLLRYTQTDIHRAAVAGHDDYRDRLPTPLDEVVREYEDMVEV